MKKTTARMEPVYIVLSLILLFSGTLILTLCIFLFSGYMEAWNRLIEMPAEISEIRERGDSHIVYVSYTYEGEIYQDSIGSYHSAMYIGQPMTVSIDPENPAACYGVEYKVLPPIFYPLGVLLILAGIAVIPFGLHQRKGAQLLLDRGGRLEGEVVAVQRVWYTRIGGKAPWRVICRCEDEKGRTYRFQSDYILQNPAALLREQERLPICWDSRKGRPRVQIVSPPR